MKVLEDPSAVKYSNNQLDLHDSWLPGQTKRLSSGSWVYDDDDD